MIRKTLLTLSIVLAVLLAPSVSYAKIVCTQEYGQPVVCVEEEEQVLAVHVPVEAGILDNTFVIGTSFIVASRLIVYLARKKKASTL